MKVPATTLLFYAHSRPILNQNYSYVHKICYNLVLKLVVTTHFVHTRNLLGHHTIKPFLVKALNTMTSKPSASVSHIHFHVTCIHHTESLTLQICSSTCWRQLKAIWNKIRNTFLPSANTTLLVKKILLFTKGTFFSFPTKAINRLWYTSYTM